MKDRLLLIALWLLAVPAAAHEGHTHADAAPAPVADLAPRMEARSELFELVAVLDGEQLRLYLDRADSNAPVEGAEIEVDAGATRLVASAAGEGVYLARLPAVALPGAHPLVFAVSAGEQLDLLNGTLTVPPAAAAQAAPGIGPAVWLGGGVAALLGGGLLLALRRKGGAT